MVFISASSRSALRSVLMGNVKAVDALGARHPLKFENQHLHVQDARPLPLPILADILGSVISNVSVLSPRLLLGILLGLLA
jgi:hypothetical protein